MFTTRRLALATALAVLAGISTQAQVQSKAPAKSKVKAQAKGPIPVAGILKWKFKEGERFQYVIDKQTITKTSQMIELKTSQTFDMTWTIKKVLRDGSAEMTQTFDRIRFKTEGMLGKNPLDSVAFDSKESKDPQGPATALGQVLRTLVGNDATLTMTALGEVKDLKLPQTAVVALKDEPQPISTQSPLTENDFKEIIMESTLVLPGKRLAANDTWTERRQKKGPQGSIAENITYTFRSPNAQSNGLDRIDVKDVMVPIFTFGSLQAQNFEGTVDFDREAGRIATSKSERKLKWRISETLEMETKTTTSVSLQDGARPK